MDVRSALKEAMGRLREGGVPSHTLAAELLLMYALGRDRAWLYAHPEQELDSTTVERFFGLVARRIAGAPTQYLTRHQEFWGLELEVEPGVFIPRPETEHVVEVALERIGRRIWEDELTRTPAPYRPATERIADVGTGSGCLAIALACELPGAEIFATDISPAALAVARRNAARHGVAHRIHFLQCNLLDAVVCSPLATRLPAVVPAKAGHSPLSFDLIVSNPPYVGQSEAEQLPREVREHEPQEALFAGEHGGEFYEPLIRQAKELLGPAGILVVELGYNLAGRVRSLLEGDRGWRNIGVTNDLAGIPRVLAAARA